MSGFNDRLAHAGIADTRRDSVNRAMDTLHSAVCEMDSANRELFWRMVERHGGMRELLRAYARHSKFLSTDV